ncbi:MAG: hypothetical protein H6559_26995 [Lewinellaceae bacterium]|nr:hypothetical protein [Lewinellaceae bacterium]
MTRAQLSFASAALLLALSSSAPAQVGNTAYADLAGNQAKARFSAAGHQLQSPDWKEGLTVPYLPGLPATSTLAAASLWMGGEDETGGRRFAGQDGYFADMPGTDFFPGPIDPATGAAPYGRDFNRIWAVTRYDILSLLADYEDNGLVDDPIPERLRDWPGAGNPFFEAANGFPMPNQELAPFYDRNSNGAYEPQLGEYPVIGEQYPDVIPEQMLWWVYNDVEAPHTSFPAFLPVGAEVQNLAFAFNCTDNPMLNTAIFIRHKVIKRAGGPLSDFRLGYWFAPRLGCSDDDALGCDTLLHTAYVYNFDALDGVENGCLCYGGPTFCEKTPAQAVSFLNVPMASFLYSPYNTLWPFAGPPPLSPYANLHGLWSYDTPMSVGGDGYDPGNPATTPYAFFSLPADPDGWSMYAVGYNPPAYGILSAPGTTFQQGDELILDLALSYHRQEGCCFCAAGFFGAGNLFSAAYHGRWAAVLCPADGAITAARRRLLLFHNTISILKGQITIFFYRKSGKGLECIPPLSFST